jgi:glyoxylase-like metal-dependent hydrolase (beta-lactamase superfamily II)
VIRAETHGEVVHFRLTRTALGRPLYWTGAYLVDDLLLDCGPPATARELLRALEGRRLAGLVLTHHHEDHVGAAPALCAERGLVPRVHREGLALLEHGFVQEPYRQLVWGRVPRFRAEPLGDEVSGASLRLRVLHTPGHSVDHVCLLEPDRGWLFTGDLFLAERLRYLRSDEELDRLITSLDLAAATGAKQVFCAHRGPVRGGVDALRRKSEHLRGLRERVLELVALGLPEAEVARRAIGREGPMKWFSLGRFSVRNFVRSLVRARQH